jgi:hypothetical protein
MAHDLHNLLFLLGDGIDRSAEPTGITARMAKVNDIETFDTIAARVMVESGAELLFLASHAVAEGEQVEPRFVLEFDSATIAFAGEDSPIVAECSDGSTVEYRSPNVSPQLTKLWVSVEASRHSTQIPCGLEAARPHAACIQALEVSGTAVRELPPELVSRSETAAGTLRWARGLSPEFQRSFSNGDWPRILQ